MWLILIVLGVVAEILKANAILAIPSVVEYILFGLGGLLLFIQIITYFTAKKQINKMLKRFDGLNRF